MPGVDQDDDGRDGVRSEASNKDDPRKCTRSSFASGNSLFGELIVRLSEERPGLLKAA